MNKKIVWTCIIIMTITSFNVFATTKSDEQKLKDTQKSKQNIQKALNENKKNQSKVNDNIEELGYKINITKQKIDKAQADLSRAQSKIKSTTEEIGKLQNEIEIKEDLLGERINVMYKTSDMSYIQVILSSKDMNELLSNLDMIKKIVNSDKELLTELSHNKKEIETKRADLKKKEKEIISLKSSIEVEKSRLVASKNKQTALKRDLQKDAKKLEANIDALNRYAKALEAEILKKQSKGSYVGGQMGWPAPGYNRITSYFGYRIHPVLKTKKLHTGVDIGAPMGASIVAANDGKVMFSGWKGGYGNTVMIDHGGGIVTLYAHNSKLLVKNGQKVKRGQAIAKAGSTGRSTGPHCHFEVRKNGKYVNPLPLLKSK
ncbi:MAG: peptidoglycan DD-metalloendopeptidase family protein [Tepidibacter sp.]|uniref:murein hydrolase activator EnvC family protein n=1 Tax=Tepidibacter sp. TaxID=2529387 RepID=UPI0025F45252|nr:peptidoglycan DD-metalloendopeptidase family protein [Tepidibacter sp.]MCT4507656.1 peptidoglycan DD-metalloendopeptidase family protein [Tepidibacter sp.]